MSVVRPLRPILAFAFACAPISALAEEPPIPLELNRLETTGTDCRATMLVTNGLAVRLDSLKVEFVVFDADGIAVRHLAAEFGPLAAGKTVVKAFPVAGIVCERVSRLLVNGVLGCAGPEGAVPDCVDRIAVSSRAAATLFK